MFVMSPTLKKLEEHIASGSFLRLLVCPFIMFFDAHHNFRNVHATALKFLIWIPHEKSSVHIFFFLNRIMPFPELWLFEKIRM